MVLFLRGASHQGDGGGGGGGGGRAGGEMQQQVALGAVDVQGLGAVFAAARLLSSPDHVFESSIHGRGVSLSQTGGRGLGKHARGEFNRVRDDRVAALQQMP